MADGSSLVLAGGATTSGLTALDGSDFNGITTVAFDSEPIASTVYDVLVYGDGLVTGTENLNVALAVDFTAPALRSPQPTHSPSTPLRSNSSPV